MTRHTLTRALYNIYVHADEIEIHVCCYSVTMYKISEHLKYCTSPYKQIICYILETIVIFSLHQCVSVVGQNIDDNN